MPTITAPGVGSGLDINNLISQLVAAEGQPATLRLDSQEARFQAQISGLGSLKGSLSQFSTALQDLKSLDDFQGRLAKSADEDVFTATATSAATPGSFDVEVIQLAEAHKLASEGFADAATSVGSGSITLTTGTDSFSVTIDPAADTLADIRDAINDAADNTGVSATIVTVDKSGGGSESKLILSADQTGTDNELSVIVDDDDGEDLDTNGLSKLVYDPAPGSGTTHMSGLQAAVDAQIKIDGQSVTRSSNSIDNAIEGVTIDLVKQMPGSEFTLTVSQDEAGATAAVNGFVNAYNALIVTINNLSTFNPETGERGLLLGDSTLLSVSLQLRRELSTSVVGAGSGFSTLADIGITTTADGTLEIDGAALSDALDTGFDAVGELFAADDGFAVRLDTVVDELIKFDGTIANRTDGLNARVDDINEQREALDRRLISLEERLLAKFTAMDALVGELQATSNFLTQQLTALQAGTSQRTQG